METETWDTAYDISIDGAEERPLPEAQMNHNPHSLLGWPYASVSPIAKGSMAFQNSNTIWSPSLQTHECFEDILHAV